jgi:hypothetical protein
MKDVRFQQHALAPAVGSVIDRPVTIGRKVAELSQTVLDAPGILSFAQEARPENSREHFRKQSDEIEYQALFRLGLTR